MAAPIVLAETMQLLNYIFLTNVASA